MLQQVLERVLERCGGLGRLGQPRGAPQRDRPLCDRAWRQLSVRRHVRFAAHTVHRLVGQLLARPRRRTMIYGPYLRKVPPLPVGPTNYKNTHDGASTAAAARRRTAGGWFYNPNTGDIKANLADTQVDSTASHTTRTKRASATSGLLPTARDTTVLRAVDAYGATCARMPIYDHVPTLREGEAFSMIELVLVIAIIAVVRRWRSRGTANSLHNYRATMAARRIAGDLQMAQFRARSPQHLAHGDLHRVRQQLIRSPVKAT